MDATTGLAFGLAALAEGLIQLTVAALIVTGVATYTYHGSLLLAAAGAVVGYYGGSLVVLISLGLAYRLAPFDRRGPVTSNRERVGFLFAVALSNFLYRSVGVHLLTSPPIATAFYRLSGSSLAGPILHGGTRAVRDPWGIDVGKGVILGMGASVYSHLSPGTGPPFAAPVQLGDGALVGVSAVVLPGARIGAGSIVLPNSTVTVDTVIPPHEIWGGNPARLVKRRRGVTATLGSSNA